MNKRAFAVLSLIVVLALALTACGATSSSGGTKVKKIGFSTDVGRIDDKSFNQSSWEGVQQAGKAVGAEVKYVVTTDAKDYAKNIQQFTDAGYDVVVTSGFGYGTATGEAAAKWPNVRFIGVDQSQATVLPNSVGLIFDEDKSGFLAGALAACMTKSGVVGAVLGTDVVPPVVKFGKGYENGAKYVTPGIKVVMAYHPGGLAKGFTDPDWGASTSKAMIEQSKADVIFGAGGDTGNGALLYNAKPEVNVMSIGVDSDQYLTLAGAQKVLLSSAMKLITPGVVDVIKSIPAGKFVGGNVTGPVGLAPYHDWDSKIPKACKDKITTIDKGLRDGSIKTNVVL
jgi:basic membrane protein A and related proteins